MAKSKRTLKATEHKIEDFAADLGTMLGQARNKAEGWLGQRKAIVKHLMDVRETATGLLKQLGHEIAEMPFHVPQPSVVVQLAARVWSRL